jgi:energy-coupling factor transporter ATP-binding protein EcfA2
MIRRISIEGFKSIAALDIELGRVNCFIGANGVGKSNILEAVGILGAAAAGRVDDEALLRRGVRAGTPRLYKSAFADLRARPHITLSAESDEASYRVALLNPLDDPLPAWAYKTEKLIDGQESLVSRGVKSISLEPSAGLAALRLVDVPTQSPSAELMRALKSYAIYSPNTPTLRGIEPDQQTRAPIGLSGGRLAEAV